MKIIIILLFMFSAIPVYSFHNKQLPENDIGTGPSIAYVFTDNSRGYSINYDTAYTYGYCTASVNAKYLNMDDIENFGLQSEFTFWFFLNIGGGIGYLGGDTEGFIYHGFIGFPIGDDDFKHGPFHSYYIEPYYRLNYFNSEFIHEFGIMLKITTYTI
ncbi:MAG: hypothetical protein JW982_01765 [Spirochaetes bacterium]|nr:hypothetical protein [Spirochaetota bacterium]